MVGGVFPPCLIWGRLCRCGGGARGTGRGGQSMFRAGRCVGGRRPLRDGGRGVWRVWAVRGRGLGFLGR